MKKLLLSLLIYILIFSNGYAQTVTIKGIVTDEKDNSAMMGVNVKIKGTTNGMATDENGNYEIKTTPGGATLEVTYVGYQNRTVDVLTFKDGEVKTVNIKMTDIAKEMNIVVVSGSKTEKKFGQEMQSIEVLKGQNITQGNQGVSEAVNKVPGVNMIGKTISIRGSSGFADATSNRTLVMLDDVPMVSPENGSVRWEFMPVEAIDQLEIIKGPSTVPHGSQALSGLINVRTTTPQKGDVINKIYSSIGLYQPYQDPSFTDFWKKNGKTKVPPVMGSVSYIYGRKFKNLDFVYNGGYQQNQGYTAWNKNLIVRNYVKLRYTPAKVKNLTVGTAINFGYQKFDDFFIYKDYNDTNSVTPRWGATPTNNSYVLFPTDSQVSKVYALNFNPYINYYDKAENKHSLRLGYYMVRQDNTTGDSSINHKIYGEYLFSRKFKKADVEIVTGLRTSYKKISSVTFGNRQSTYAAFFAQVEKKFDKRFTIKVGFSLEYNKLDTVRTKNELTFLNTLSNKDSAHYKYSPVKPIFNVGINYQITEATFLRASFGQGYRYPDIAEMFIQTPKSGAYAVPNFRLQPESNWSAEVGLKQGFKISKWVFYADLSAYFTRYKNQIEFLNVKKSDIDSSIRVNIPPSYFIFAQAKNIAATQVWGIEFSAIGTGKIFGVPLNFLLGYNYMNPRNLNWDPKNPNSQYLNYRIDHSAKADVQTTIKSFIIGFTAIYIGRMQKIDPQIQQLSKIADWRNEHGTKGDFVLDARVGYNYKDKLTATIIAKNFTNHAYTLRPGFIEAPANYTLQVTYQFGKIFPLKKKVSEEDSNASM